MAGFKQDLKETFSLRGMSAKELFRRVIAEVQQDNCEVYAAALAYYFLFALFPFFLSWQRCWAISPFPT
jgi:membrane protein